jgi:anti-sigma regulatory factor (Ser/Thr protein kinase)
MESADGLRQRGERDFVSSTESIGEARDFVRTVLRDDAVDEATIDDVTLAVSELVTNAVVHGAGGLITVRIETAPHEVVCGVRSTGGPLPDPETWTSPGTSGRTGRGLVIVRAVADTVVVEDDGLIVELRCSFRRR